MTKKLATPAEPVPFEGLELHNLEEVDVQAVDAAVWVFLRRKDGSIVRIWIRHPSHDAVPLSVVVEVEDV